MKKRIKLLLFVFISLFWVSSANSQRFQPNPGYYNPYSYNQSNLYPYNVPMQTFRKDIGVYGYSQIYDYVMRTGYRVNINTWQKRERELLLFTGRRLDVLAVYSLTIVGRTSYLRADYYMNSHNIGYAVYEGRMVTTILYYR